MSDQKTAWVVTEEEFQEMSRRAREVSPLLDMALICHPEDYMPWGDKKRWSEPEKLHNDCSQCCKWAIPLEDLIGADWVVCCNKKSHRAGLLTFEHQGCEHWEMDERLEADAD